MNNSYTLTNTSRKVQIRPSSASRKSYGGIKVGSMETPPPIIFTMPNNPNKLSGMGNKIEREQLYENNLQLKDIINKLKKELAETRNQVVKKDIEIRKKDKIIKECNKENDFEDMHEINLEKARESTLVSLCKDRYNELKRSFKKKCEEYDILNANIKITKLKEYQIQIDVLKSEMEKLRKLYLSTLDDNNRLNGFINEYQVLKDKYIDQHNIINNLMKKCNQYNNDINDLKEENAVLKEQLEQYKRKRKQLYSDKLKLQISNRKYMEQKKNKESYDINIDDKMKSIGYLEKERKEYKRLYELKNQECNKFIEENRKLKDSELKKKQEKESLKPFNYKSIKFIENKKESPDSNKTGLYKSLLDESRHKIDIYELYLKKIGVDKDKLMKEFGFDGVMNANMREINDRIRTDVADNNNINNTNNNNNGFQSLDNNITINSVESINIQGRNNTGNSISISENTRSDAYTRPNTIASNPNQTNPNGLPSIEEEKQEEQIKEENLLLSLLHVFVKNIEAQGVTKEDINQKIDEICKLFENKEEATKEEFIAPFSKMLIETMKVTQEKDIEIINNFLNDFVDSLNGETAMFFNGLMEIFENIKDYNGVDKNDELSFGLKKHKNELIERFKKYDTNNTNLVTFDIFRKIVQELNIIFDDETMEYLVYEMKKNVPENNSIFDLNYQIILNLLEKDEIGDIFNNIKNNLTNKQTTIDKECQDYINVVEYEEFKFLIIKKDDFFKVLENLGISLEDKMKESIYECFKIEIETDKTEQVLWMEYDKIRSEFEFEDKNDQ